MYFKFWTKFWKNVENIEKFWRNFEQSSENNVCISNFEQSFEKMLKILKNFEEILKKCWKYWKILKKFWKNFEEIPKVLDFQNYLYVNFKIIINCIESIFWKVLKI